MTDGALSHMPQITPIGRKLCQKLALVKQSRDFCTLLGKGAWLQRLPDVVITLLWGLLQEQR